MKLLFVAALVFADGLLKTNKVNTQITSTFTNTIAKTTTKAAEKAKSTTILTTTSAAITATKSAEKAKTNTLIALGTLSSAIKANTTTKNYNEVKKTSNSILGSTKTAISTKLNGDFRKTTAILLGTSATATVKIGTTAFIPGETLIQTSSPIAFTKSAFLPIVITIQPKTTFSQSSFSISNEVTPQTTALDIDVLEEYDDELVDLKF